MGIGRWIKRSEGQVTVEMAIAIPVAIAVAVIAVNALAFMAECAAFDQQARKAIATFGASPGYGQTKQGCASAIQAELSGQFARSFEHVSVSVQGSSPGLVRYTATIAFTPTLLGRSFSGSVFGVHIPPLSHSVHLSVDPYKPGVVV